MISDWLLELLVIPLLMIRVRGWLFRLEFPVVLANLEAKLDAQVFKYYFATTNR